MKNTNLEAEQNLKKWLQSHASKNTFIDKIIAELELRDTQFQALLRTMEPNQHQDNNLDPYS